MIEVFCNWHDQAQAADRTMSVLSASGATRAILMVQPAIASDRGLRMYGPVVARFADRCVAAGVQLSMCTGLGVLEAPDQQGAINRLTALCDDHGATPMLDAEPLHVRTPREVHWTPQLLKRWLEVPEMEVTTTRAEVAHLGQYDRRTYVQLEGQTSTATISHAYSLFRHYVASSPLVPTIGDFDSPGDPRTLDDVRVDLERCRPYALEAGALAVWVAQTTSPAEAALLRTWAERA